MTRGEIKRRYPRRNLRDRYAYKYGAAKVQEMRFRSPHRPMINGQVNGRRTINEKEDLLMSAKISDQRINVKGGRCLD